MTGQACLKQALRLLGYTDTLGSPDSAQYTEFYKRGLAVVNQLVFELSAAETGRCAEPLASLRQPLPLTERTAKEVLPYGVAMWLASSQGDGDNQRLFAALYDQKRVAVCRESEQIHDTLPRGWDT